MSAVYNYLFRPLLTPLVRATFLKRVFGIPFASRIRKVAVRPPFGEHVGNALGAEAMSDLEAISRDRLAKLSPVLRSKLMMLANGKIDDQLRDIQNSGGALIHTAYLESDLVIDVIARAISDRQT